MTGALIATAYLNGLENEDVAARGRESANTIGMVGQVTCSSARPSATVAGRTRCRSVYLLRSVVGAGEASRWAIAAASSRWDMPSLRRMFETWTDAVLTLMVSSAAIWRLV
jgi:hypothetical protein